MFIRSFSLAQQRDSTQPCFSTLVRWGRYNVFFVHERDIDYGGSLLTSRLNISIWYAQGAPPRSVTILTSWQSRVSSIKMYVKQSIYRCRLAHLHSIFHNGFNLNKWKTLLSTFDSCQHVGTLYWHYKPSNYEVILCEIHVIGAKWLHMLFHLIAASGILVKLHTSTV